MAGYLNDRVLDFGLNEIDTNANKLLICNALPTTYAEANATFAMGNKTGPTISAPQDNGSNGRKVVISAITDGALTATGTGSHWALVDTANSRLLAAGPVATPQSVANGGIFTTSSFDIYIPDAV